MLDRLLEGLYSHGLAAGRRVRAKTAISRGAISFPSIAVDLARTLLGDLCDRRAVVVGAGKIGRTAARQLASGGAYVVVANRSPGAAKRIAREVAGHETALAGLGEELRAADVAVCATGAPSYLVSRRMLARVTDQRDVPLVVIDVAMPRDVEPTATDLPAVTLRDIDDIHRIADRNLDDRRAELPRARAIVRSEAERFRIWRASGASCGRAQLGAVAALLDFPAPPRTAPLGDVPRAARAVR
jgi:glutamyl-tRNA reductase